MKKSNKKKVLFTSILITLILAYPYKHKYRSNYCILDDEAFASYSGGLIYIGDEEYINNLDNINNGDILVIDERYKNDPNMIINILTMILMIHSIMMRILVVTKKFLVKITKKIK